MRIQGGLERGSGGLLVTMVVAVAVLAACGDSDDGGGSAGAGAGRARGDGGTVTVEHRYGTTEVPTRPHRVVSLDTQWTDVLLALDAPPVGTLVDPNLASGDFPWRGDSLADATRIEAPDALPYEQIAELRPDLIVVTYLAEERDDYETLSDIAPTIPILSANQVDSWQDIARVAGTFLDDPGAAEALIDDVDSRVAAVADELPGLRGKTFALVNYIPGDSFNVVADPEDGANVVFGQLGLEIAPRLLEAADDVSGRVRLSLEQASLLDADLLVLFTNGAEPTGIPGYQDLPAVTTGAVSVLDYADVVALNTPTPLSVPYALDLIRPALDAAA
jgi:iron complex transport system substrate-binding protein